MGIRDKLLDFKRRLSDRKMYSIVITLIAAVSIWGIYQYKHAANLRQELDNQYNRAFYEMVGYVNNVETLLAKSMISTTSSKTAATLQEAWRQATMAQTNLGQLPVSQPVLASTSKFLTQVGDLSLSLDNQNIRGKTLNDDQYKTVENMYKYSTSLNKSLRELQNDLGTGRLRWGELANKGTKLFSKTSSKNTMKKIEAINTTFQDYPTLIYDGPFSDHMTTAEARGLTGDMMNSEEAKKNVRKFLGEDRVKDVKDVGKSDSGPIKTFSYNVTLKDASKDQTINIGVSQKGGHVIWMLYNRPVKESKIDMDKAKKAGRDFLAGKGYKNMEDTYYLTQNNIATINYAYRQNGVTVYPDLIKLKVALDTGEIVGIEAKTYLSNHTERKIPDPKISAEEARKKINGKLQLHGSGMAIIPTNYKKELFCYEFKGKLNNNDFIIYINAETGEEEDILMIVNTPNGVLTM
ncbi:MAG: germination protein YpeB [Clostridiaceae bacterium]